VDRVLHLLSQRQLFLKQSKCSLGTSEVEYLGHLVGKDGIRVDPKKIEAMQDWPHPKTLKSLRGFLGLTGYYRKFVKNYGKIATPLTALLKKNSFTWTPAAAQDFQTLKMAMCTTPVLSLLDFTETFVLKCDASGKGIGVVLMQEGRPLAFTSKQLSERNLGKSIYEKEMLAIMHVMDLWHPYLLGQQFQIKTNHQSLKYFLEQCISSPEQQKWVTKLFGYDYEIIYKKGKDNLVVDALSRKYEDEGSIFSLSFIVLDWLQVVRQEWLQDPKSSQLIQQLQSNAPTSPGYSWLHEELRYKGCLYLSKQSNLKSTVLSELHATPTAGHSGFTKTYDRVKRSFFWDGMKQDIHNFVAECDVCQCNKGETVKSSAHYNHSRFHLLFGRISLWILLPAYPNREINPSSWWLLIAFPSMLISTPFNTHLQHPRWLKSSWIRSSRFMVCLTLLFLIATQLSQAIFGKNC
jgi:hypothetical protein